MKYTFWYSTKIPTRNEQEMNAWIQKQCTGSLIRLYVVYSSRNYLTMLVSLLNYFIDTDSILKFGCSRRILIKVGYHFVIFTVTLITKPVNLDKIHINSFALSMNLLLFDQFNIIVRFLNIVFISIDIEVDFQYGLVFMLVRYFCASWSHFHLCSPRFKAKEWFSSRKHVNANGCCPSYFIGVFFINQPFRFFFHFLFFTNTSFFLLTRATRRVQGAGSVYHLEHLRFIPSFRFVVLLSL